MAGTPTDPAAAVDVMNARFGRHPRRRALHAKGIWCRGTFTGTPEGRELSRAAHLAADSVPVLARLSNGGGNPKVPDYAPDVRGLAVSFELPDGSKTDLVSQSVPKFFSSGPEEFLDFIRANTGRSAARRRAGSAATIYRRDSRPRCRRAGRSTCRSPTRVTRSTTPRATGRRSGGASTPASSS
jgi:catalase